ncbi:cytochrome P450 [Photorhabdus temperata]|uniref:Cytochrome P450 n=1 Tax=Photorhabdus temperata subsp. temperata Meg1 TaxID=1393735 RepID=A0A081RZ78_PHOTE|nr:cytochrome P450 [Photorhabdus temperata]KER03981.1 cytochrome P450 [Photorhabdus temperata subsp. temperata Meg1]MCT8347109.1 cytochrome P450 [Photorhabdus temperata]
MRYRETNLLILNNIDLTDPSTHLRPDINALWTTLRKETPVAWHPEVNGQPGFWVVSSHQYASQVYRDSEVYSSTQGNVLATLLRGGDSAGGKMLAVSDGERHREIRKVLLRSFSPKNLESLQEKIKTAMHELIGRAVRNGIFDFAIDVAPKIPLSAICDILQIPEDDREKLFTDSSSALASNLQDAEDVDARIARNRVLMYFFKLVQKRKLEAPGEDLVSNLIAMSYSDIALTQEELIFNCYSLLLGGDETTRLTMIGIIKAFSEHPESWHQLRQGNVETGKAVEELLRWTTPALHSGRTATRDTELGGIHIKAGEIVTVWIKSANFDESVFHNPGVLDLSRAENRHFSFAYGAHFCLGAVLARIEIAALLNALVEQVQDIVLVSTPLPIYSTFLSGFHSLPVRFTPAISLQGK